MQLVGSGRLERLYAALRRGATAAVARAEGIATCPSSPPSPSEPLDGAPILRHLTAAHATGAGQRSWLHSAPLLPRRAPFNRTAPSTGFKAVKLGTGALLGQSRQLLCGHFALWEHVSQGVAPSDRCALSPLIIVRMIENSDIFIKYSLYSDCVCVCLSPLQNSLQCLEHIFRSLLAHISSISHSLVKNPYLQQTARGLLAACQMPDGYSKCLMSRTIHRRHTATRNVPSAARASFRRTSRPV